MLIRTLAFPIRLIVGGFLRQHRRQVGEAHKYAEFINAASLDQAVSAFVWDVERPRDISGQIFKRLSIARKLLA
jgi:hypothetical protein